MAEHRSARTTSAAQHDRLDPAGWDHAEVEAALDWRRIRQDERPAAASGGSAVLVGSTGPFATLAGRHALEAGGSATDAVLTTAFTQIALSLGAWVSYAGLFGLVHHEAATGATTTVSGGFGTFAGETGPLDIPAPPQPSGRTALVPGFVAGAHAAHGKSGRLPWDRLWSPARHVIERGIPVNAHLERMLTIRADVLTRTDEGRAIFAPDGRVPRAGELFFQPRLAKTVAALAEQGPDWMYRGPWAEHFVSAVRRDGGHAALDDLANYRAHCAEPVWGSFAGHEIAGLPTPDTGGAELLAALARLEAAGIGEPSQDPRSLAGFLSALDNTPPGSHSDYVLAVDREGNVASLCHSINTAMWGTTGIVVDGIPLPDAAAFQQPLLASLAPGDHLPMPVEPAIALRAGRPVLACSSIGVGLHQATLLGLHRVLALGRPVAEAVAEPLVHGPDIIAGDSVTSVVIEQESRTPSHVVDERFSPECVTAARDAGYAVTTRSADDPVLPRGFWAAITTDPDTGAHTGARTPYGQGPVRTTSA
ncbi:gamma-glutamyltransferase [Amycolatopsis saalfeldensis]|uniref:Gamma-glutamyltranspeptidase / glutathione hydrolase n=1 Tax=Amycolatopsis saalfeldensis TaxID=394193 RepID=A0A1H8YKL1_9PSEU|nr:gamma-glutamyltransferase [Amycolatopsis saalfeldensis]SEP52581.1 gamma-glutamyltranspeptidase / glutathione hydrolase [Amycolatopsis saalfeldensis]